MKKRTRSILEELNNLGRVQDNDLLIELSKVLLIYLIELVTHMMRTLLVN
jgi:hypothetical protein